MTQEKESLICIAIIAAPHGIKGDVKITPYTENIEDIFNYKDITDSKGNKIILKKKFISKCQIVASIDGVSDRNACEKMTGTNLYIKSTDLPVASEGEFYHLDLVGLAVLNSEQVEVGKVKYVHNFGAGSILEIDFIEKRNNNMILFSKENFPEIDMEKRIITFADIEF
jgi:16S rRNA processing protein RimM